MQIDKASILNDTILYLKELEARVEELESCMDLTDSEGRSARRKFPDLGEQTSDNNENGKFSEGKKQPWINKRKACNIDGVEKLELNPATPREGQPLDLKVHVKDRDVRIEMGCRCREHLLLDIMEAINNLHLDAHSIKSSTHDGILTLTLTAKVRKILVVYAVT